MGDGETTVVALRCPAAPATAGSTAATRVADSVAVGVGLRSGVMVASAQTEGVTVIGSSSEMGAGVPTGSAPQLSKMAAARVNEVNAPQRRMRLERLP